MSKKLSDYEKRVWRHICAVVGGDAVRVVEYLDRDETARIAMCLMPDFPVRGVTTYATIGPSELEVRSGLGVELIAACESSRPEFGDVVSTAAFFVVKDGWLLEPGSVFEDVARIGWPETTLPHLLLIDPFLFQERGLESLDLEERTVTWLMPVPISDAELALAKDRGVEHLQSVFEKAQIDLYDAERPSVV